MEEIYGHGKSEFVLLQVENPRGDHVRINDISSHKREVGLNSMTRQSRLIK